MINNDIKLDFDDVLIVPQRSKAASRKEIQIERKFKFYHSPKIWSGIPIMVANMSGIAGVNMAKAMNKKKIITCLHKHLTNSQIEEVLTSSEDAQNYSWVSIGYNDSEINRLKTICVNTGIEPNICIDVPNGYMDTFVEFCNKVRKKFPLSIVMAGNVTTANMTQELLIHGGVDIVKTQIGPGSACATRMMTGVGYGTLSCVLECSHTAHGLKSGEKNLGLICSDGGCKTPGDVCKALSAGADFVMLGGYFSGTEECDSEWIEENGKKYSIHYGMSTHYAQNKHAEGKKEYRASEGIIKKIPYKGSVDVVTQELLGGIRSCCAYIGATSIKDMSKCAEFCRVNKIHNNQSSDVVFGV